MAAVYNDGDSDCEIVACVNAPQPILIPDSDNEAPVLDEVIFVFGIHCLCELVFNLVSNLSNFRICLQPLWNQHLWLQPGWPL